MIPRLGIAEQIKARIRISKGFPVGVLVAKGEAEIGIHQIAELMPIKGIDIVGELPAEIQTTLIYATGIHANAKQPEAARALARFLYAGDVGAGDPQERHGAGAAMKAASSASCH